MFKLVSPTGNYLEGLSVEAKALLIIFNEKLETKRSITSVVGNLDTIETMQSILENGQADMVSLGRLLLRDPYWPSRLAYAETGKKFFPEQYADGFRGLVKN